MQLDYVRVVKLGQDHQLSIGSLSISGVLEGVEYFLEGVGGFGATIDGLPYMTVRPAAHQFFRFVKTENVLFDLFTHRNRNIFVLNANLVISQLF